MKTNPPSGPLTVAARINRRYERAAARSEELRIERHDAILAALDAGWSQRQVAARLGVTSGRIAQLASPAARRAREATLAEGDEEER